MIKWNLAHKLHDHKAQVVSTILGIIILCKKHITVVPDGRNFYKFFYPTRIHSSESVHYDPRYLFGVFNKQNFVKIDLLCRSDNIHWCWWRNRTLSHSLHSVEQQQVRGYHLHHDLQFTSKMHFLRELVWIATYACIVYVRQANFTTKPLFKNLNLLIHAFSEFPRASVSKRGYVLSLWYENDFSFSCK